MKQIYNFLFFFIKVVHVLSLKSIDVFEFSPFFKVNDGKKNNIWKVQGINFKPLVKNYIFDRYEKLIKQFFLILNEGWRGSFNYNGIITPEGE